MKSRSARKKNVGKKTKDTEEDSLVRMANDSTQTQTPVAISEELPNTSEINSKSITSMKKKLPDKIHTSPSTNLANTENDEFLNVQNTDVLEVVANNNTQNSETFKEVTDSLEATETSKKSHIIGPPSLFPEIHSKTKFSMFYKTSDNETYSLDYQKKPRPQKNGNNTSNPRIRIYQGNRVKNLKSRTTPYDRVAENDNCTAYEGRENRKYRDAFGKRYLRAGSVIVCFVCDDNKTQIVSNPEIIGANVPPAITASVNEYLTQYLSTNPINIQSTENPRNQRHHLCEIIRACVFVESAVNTFLSITGPHRSMLSVIDALQQFPEEYVSHIATTFQSRNLTKFRLSCPVEELSTHQKYAWVLYSLLLHAEFMLAYVANSFVKTAPEEWNALYREISRWHAMYYIPDEIPLVLFDPGMSVPKFNETTETEEAINGVCEYISTSEESSDFNDEEIPTDIE
jgi:hypothetical protein